jgi:hypothetical protein
METAAPVEEPTTLQKLRNMWQFANLAQYIFLFKGALKIDDDFGIEVRVCARRAHRACRTHSAHWLLMIAQELETECLMPQPSPMLAAIGLALLKHVSSHKGLTYAHSLLLVHAHTYACIDPTYSMNIRDASSWQRPRRTTPSVPTRSLISLTTWTSSPKSESFNNCQSGR